MVTRMISAGLLLAATAAIAQTPTARSDSALRPPNNNPDQIVCIKEAKPGSRIAQRRVCRTRAEWEQLQAQTRDVVERVQLQSLRVCQPNC